MIRVCIVNTTNPASAKPNSSTMTAYFGDNIVLEAYEGSNTYEYFEANTKFSISGASMHRAVIAALKGYGSKEAEFPEERYEYLGAVPYLANTPSIICRASDKIRVVKADIIGLAKIIIIRAAVEKFVCCEEQKLHIWASKYCITMSPDLYAASYTTKIIASLRKKRLAPALHYWDLLKNIAEKCKPTTKKEINRCFKNNEIDLYLG